MNKINLIILVFIFGSFVACKKEVKETWGVWNSDPVQGINITPINGGATVSYDLPADDNLLYVMVEYERNGKIFTEKASVYKNTFTIEGFNTTGPVKATLYKVNKQGQRSEPAEIEFTPLESLVSIAEKSLRLQPGFGGIVANWSNPYATELGVRVLVKDSTGEWVDREMYFTTIQDERHSFRGFEPKLIETAFSFEDKWGNVSDTVYYSTTPYFETMVSKPYVDYRSNIPYDNTSTYNTSSRPISRLWDGIVNTAGNGWLTSPGYSGLSMTFDMKQVVKLSRIIIHGYHINSPYTQANITQFELWGTNKIDYYRLSDLPYWLDSLSVRWGAIAGVDPTTELPTVSFKNDWQYLGWYSIPRYTATADIYNLAASGAEYEMPIDANPVRYVRLFVREIASMMPPPSNNYWSMGEITFYGDNTVPQQ